MTYQEILYAEDGPVGTITLNRPDDGNMFTPRMCHEIRDCINEIRRETRTRVTVITGAGERFFCIGGRKEGMEKTTLYAGTLPTLDMYESIERLQKPVIASVNGFAVGGGNVLQVVCDLTIAKESAVFRQVGPMMGSFDAGYGTWHLEDLVGKKRAKEIWMLNPRMTAREALAIGLVNRVVPDGELKAATRQMAPDVAQRGAFALASIKAAFAARHNGVSGLSRITHDLLLRPYLDSAESHELGTAFEEMRDALEGRKQAERHTQALVHEVKTPLAAIRGAAELLQEEMPPEQRRRFLENIRAETGHMQRIVERLFKLSTVEAKKALSRPERMTPRELINETFGGVRPAFEAAGVRLTSTGETKAEFVGERFLLRQALANLLQNALDFSPPDGCVELRSVQESGRIAFIVEDEGPGVPDYALGRVFERFYSLPRPLSGQKSTGIGLSLVREIARLHGGDASLGNRPEGKGARAVFWISAG